jgi:tetratricopeptide (TPR) repeat protein
LQRAIELGPDYGRAYYNLGVVYMRLGVPDLALENFIAAARYEGDPNAWHDAGYVSMVTGDYEAARERFGEAVEREYLAFIALLYLGILEKREGRKEQAAGYFDRCLADIDKQDSGPEPDVNLATYRALALALRGNKEHAESILHQVAAGELHGGEVHYQMARAYAALGQNDEAQACLEDAYQHHDGPTPREIALDPLLRDLPK